jgi:hypothetical protein
MLKKTNEKILAMIHISETHCMEYLRANNKIEYRGPDGIGCPGVYDKVMCWEAQPPNTIINIGCPSHKEELFDTKSNIFSKI